MSEVGSLDPQIALLLLRHRTTFCKLVHLAHSTPPALCLKGLALFDAEVRRHFCDCVAIDPSDSEWQQVQLSLSMGGLGLRRLALHCSAAYLARVNKAGCSESCLSQKDLSSRIDDNQFDQLCLISTPANFACLLSVIMHASSWLAVIPSRGLNLSLDPEEFQVALKWWLGMDTSSQLRCPYCPDHQLDPFGHHAVTCKGSGDVVLCHNSLRDVFTQFCHRARLDDQLEVGHAWIWG